jgi:hypothetical protein
MAPPSPGVPHGQDLAIGGEELQEEEVAQTATGNMSRCRRRQQLPRAHHQSAGQREAGAPLPAPHARRGRGGEPRTVRSPAGSPSLPDMD